MTLRNIFITIVLLVATNVAFSQSNDRYYDRINNLLDRVVSLDGDSARIATNDMINNILDELLRQEGSFYLPFDSVRHVGKIVSNDKKISLYSWVIPLKQSSLYNVVLQREDDTFFRLTKIADKEKIDEQQIDSALWYGALYYDIIPFHNKKSTFYILLGWRRLPTKQQKIIDVLNLDGDDISFGKPIFVQEKYNNYQQRNITKISHRVVFDYDSRITMFLQYNRAKKRIEFDNLSPMEVIDGKILSYGPDFSFNAYKQKKDKLIFIEDIKVKNKR